ncbi:VENN motif pre-toxin domain-containing protein [Brachymonas sp. M4Q-1]|uniref:VENN motif pre-toxin domain-containing protein n=1 Tax=Brachymonas sp. M4Q-1 TaxID=3416906 RepID=UPI003CFB1147
MASPQVAQQIGSYFKENAQDGSAAHLVAHAVLGAAVAAATGTDAVTAGVSAATAEGAAPKVANWLYGTSDPDKLSAEQKGTISAIVGLAGAAAGATTASNAGIVASGSAAQMAVEDNRMLNRSEYAKARAWASNTQILNAVAKIEGRSISRGELEARIVAEMWRNSDAAAGASGVHDYSLRSVLGCSNLNCASSSTDAMYGSASYNSKYAAETMELYLKGVRYLNYGVTYNGLVEGDVKNNPIGTGLAGVGAVGLGVVVGGPMTLSQRAIAGTLGSAINSAYQYLSNGSVNSVDAAMAGGGGFLTGGGSVLQGLTSSISVNSGGALLGSAIKGENPNGSVAAAAVGSVIGYGVGSGVESVVRVKINPWWKPDFVDTGVFGVQKINPPSVLPGLSGNITSGISQEMVGDKVNSQVGRIQGR